MSDVSRETKREEWEVCPKCGNMDGGCPFCGHGYVRAYPGHEDMRENPLRKLRKENDMLRASLREIAGCESHHPGDVVAIARAALSGGSDE